MEQPLSASGAPACKSLMTATNLAIARTSNVIPLYQPTKRDYDPTKHCGIMNQFGQPCLGSIKCSNHEAYQIRLILSSYKESIKVDLHVRKDTDLRIKIRPLVPNHRKIWPVFPFRQVKPRTALPYPQPGGFGQMNCRNQVLPPRKLYPWPITGTLESRIRIRNPFQLAVPPVVALMPKPQFPQPPAPKYQDTGLEYNVNTRDLANYMQRRNMHPPRAAYRPSLPMPPFMNAPTHYTNTPTHYTNAPTHYTTTPKQYKNSPTHYTNTPPHYTNTPTHYATTPTHYSNTPMHYTNTQTHYTNTPMHYINTPMHTHQPKPLVMPTYPLRRAGGTYGMQNPQLDFQKKAIMYSANKQMATPSTSHEEQRLRNNAVAPDNSNDRIKRRSMEEFHFENKQFRVQAYREETEFSRKNDRNH